MSVSTAPAYTVSLESGRQLGLLWGGVVLLLVVAAPLAEGFVALVPACPFRTIFGIPCATCGATTAAMALVHGDAIGALRASPLAAVGLGVFVLGGITAGSASLLGRGVPQPPRDLHWGARLAIVAVVLANWAYLVFLR